MKKLYIVCVLNKLQNNWDMISGFFWRLEEAEAIIKSSFENFKYVGGELPTMQIFYTTDIYAFDVILLSIDDREKIIIEGGLFENE